MIPKIRIQINITQGLGISCRERAIIFSNEPSALKYWHQTQIVTNEKLMKNSLNAQHIILYSVIC